MNKKTKEQKIKEEKALDACTEYLKSRGWSPLVVGFEVIEKGSRKYNFRLVLHFTGMPPKHLKVKTKETL